MDDDKEILLEYYIYSYKDISTDTFRGLITKEKIISPELYKGWELTGIFYAFNPKLRPVPSHTKIFSMEIKNYFPYDINKYKIVYDMFQLDNDNEYILNFITYNKQVPNTKRLYLHNINNSIYPSFSDISPTNTSQKNTWKIKDIDPIFVITDKNIKFYCNNGICLPAPKIKNEFINSINSSELTINECLKICNGKGKKILDIIKDFDNKNNNDKNILENNKIIIIISVISIIIILILKYYYK